MSLKRLKTLSPYLFLTVLAVLFWRRILWGGESLFYDNILRLFYPYLNFFAESIGRGEFPLWNPYLYGGLPFVAVMQSACFYPATYLFALLDFAQALSVSVAFHTALAGIFMYRLARAWGQIEMGALISAVVFMLNGFFIYHAVFLPQFSAYIWMPLIAGFAFKALTNNEWRSMGLAALCLTLQFFAGHPQFSFYTSAAVFLLAVILAAKKKIAWGRAASILGGISALFILLSAIQWLPVEELAALSARGQGMNFEEATDYSLKFMELLKSLFVLQWNRDPSFMEGDVHIKGFYLGLPVLLLAARGFWSRRREALGIWLGVILLLAFIFALGRNLPGFHLLYEWFPPFKYFRFPSQWLYLAAFAASLLAGFGLSQFRLRGARNALSLGAITMDLFIFSSRCHSFVSASFFSASTPTAEFLKKDSSLFRVMMTPETRNALGQGGGSFEEAWLRFKDSLFPNLGMTQTLYDADGYEELRLAEYDRMLSGFMRGPQKEWLRLLNVKYLLSFQELSDPDFKTRYKGSVRVIEYLKAGPRAFFVPDILMPAKIKSGKVEITHYGSNEVRLKVRSPEPGFVVLADSYFPGWEAKLNGAKAPILPVHDLFRAVPVSPGESEIVFLYKAPKFRLGMAISSISFLTLILWFYLPWRRRRSSGRSIF